MFVQLYLRPVHKSQGVQYFIPYFFSFPDETNGHYLRTVALSPSSLHLSTRILLFCIAQYYLAVVIYRQIPVTTSTCNVPVFLTLLDTGVNNVSSSCCALHVRWAAGSSTQSCLVCMCPLSKITRYLVLPKVTAVVNTEYKCGRKREKNND